jgi:hypothetical protein
MMSAALVAVALILVRYPIASTTPGQVVVQPPVFIASTVAPSYGVVIVVLATSTPDALATTAAQRRASTAIPTATAPPCGAGGLGQVCEWPVTPTVPPSPEPAPTDVPLPICGTPIPGDRCIMQTVRH